MSVDDDESLEGRDGNVINAAYPLPILTRRVVFSEIVGTSLVVYSNQALAGELIDSVIHNEPNECKNGGLVAGEPFNTCYLWMSKMIFVVGLFSSF